MNTQKNGLPPLKPGERYVTGAQQFAEQLARIPRGKKLSNEELVESFDPLFDALERVWADEGLDTPEKRKVGTMRRAEELSKDHPIPAFGYPMTFAKIVAGEIGRTEFLRLLGVEKEVVTE
jgi:hypothetical protein